MGLFAVQRTRYREVVSARAPAQGRQRVYTDAPLIVKQTVFSLDIPVYVQTAAAALSGTRTEGGLRPLISATPLRSACSPSDSEKSLQGPTRQSQGGASHTAVCRSSEPCPVQLPWLSPSTTVTLTSREAAASLPHALRRQEEPRSITSTGPSGCRHPTYNHPQVQIPPE